SPWARIRVPALAEAPRPAVLAIDGGNSKTDVALVAGDGTLLASARGPGINAHEVGVDQNVLILDAVVKQAAAQLAAQRDPRPDTVEGLEGSGPHWGVAVVCGAGINAVGVAPDGRVTRYLALGTISGDWGGGYGLGLEVLWHAIRAEDGRGPDTALAGYLTRH